MLSIRWNNLINSPITMLLSIFSGIGIGLATPHIVPYITWVKDIYLAIFRLSSLPIMLLALISGTNRLLQAPEAARVLSKFLVIVVSGFLVCNSIATALAAWNLNPRFIMPVLSILGQEVDNTGIDILLPIFNESLSIQNDVNSELSTLSDDLISDNIFSSLANGETLAVLVFAIYFGAIVSYYPKSSLRLKFLATLDLLIEIFSVFDRISQIILPFAIASLIAHSVASTGSVLIKPMFRFILLANLYLFSLYLVSIIIIWWRARKPLPLCLIQEVKRPSIIAFATASSLASLPVALKMMKNLKFNWQQICSLLPLNLITFRYGTSAYFVLITIFTLRLYQEDINLKIVLFIILNSIFASLSSIGSVGFAALSAVEVILHPLGLPVQSILVIFLAIDPFINPLRALVNTYTSIAVTALVTENQS